MRKSIVLALFTVLLMSGNVAHAGAGFEDCSPTSGYLACTACCNYLARASCYGECYWDNGPFVGNSQACFDGCDSQTSACVRECNPFGVSSFTSPGGRDTLPPW